MTISSFSFHDFITPMLIRKLSRCSLVLNPFALPETRFVKRDTFTKNSCTDSSSSISFSVRQCFGWQPRPRSKRNFDALFLHFFAVTRISSFCSSVHSTLMYFSFLSLSIFLFIQYRFQRLKGRNVRACEHLPRLSFGLCFGTFWFQNMTIKTLLVRFRESTLHSLPLQSCFCETVS